MTQKRTAIVTGANRGLGFETARQLAEADVHVLLTARDWQSAETAAAALAGEGLDVAHHACDVADPDSVQGLHGFVDADYDGGVDILVNNAGIVGDHGWYDDRSSSAFEQPVEALRMTYEVNVYGALRMLQTFVPAMRERGWGRVVNVSSGMGQLSDMNGHFPGYRTSKTALNALTRIFTDELSEFPNVKINSVCPGWVRTDLGSEAATRGLADGAKGIVWAALLDDDGPRGGFFRDGEPIDW